MDSISKDVYAHQFSLSVIIFKLFYGSKRKYLFGILRWFPYNRDFPISLSTHKTVIHFTFPEARIIQYIINFSNASFKKF